MNEAELSIVDLDFTKAFDIYSKTFAQFKNHQGSDLYNAAQCAILISENHQATQWMKEMVIRGTTLEGFKASTYKQLPQSAWDEIKSKYDSLRKVYNSNCNIAYKTVLDTLRNREQRFVNGNQQRYDSLLYEHAKILYRLISEQGIPKVSMFNGFKFPLDVMRHNFGLRNRLKYHQQCNINIATEPYKSMDFSCYDLEPILIKAVFEGELSPSFVANCMQHSELDSTRLLGAFSLSVDLNTKTIKQRISNKRTMELIDAYRESIGLESTQDAIRKDIEVKLLYNQETYPFDEVVRRYKEIGYSETVMRSLKFDSEEFNRLGHAATKIDVEIIKAYLFRNEGFDVKNIKGEIKIHIVSKWELLGGFRLNPTVVYKTIIPPFR